MKEIKMYDNASQTLKDESMAKHILKNRVMKCIFSTFFKLFIIGAVLTGLVTICVVKFLDIPRAPKGYVPAYLRYAKVIIENDRIGVKVKNGHVYKALLHASAKSHTFSKLTNRFLETSYIIIAISFFYLFDL